MLGESRAGSVTQAAFVRSLMASYIKRWETRGVGGLFGAPLSMSSSDVLQWSRTQQAAFLILVWKAISESIQGCRAEWAESLRVRDKQPRLPLESSKSLLDPAFTSTASLLATDQGVRGILQVTNDLCYVAVDQLAIQDAEAENGVVEEGSMNEQRVSEHLERMEKLPVNFFLESIASTLCTFDWRTSSAPGLDEQKRKDQMVFKGSSGYKELRRQLLHLLIESGEDRVRTAANEVWDRLGY